MAYCTRNLKRKNKDFVNPMTKTFEILKLVENQKAWSILLLASIDGGNSTLSYTTAISAIAFNHSKCIFVLF